MASSDAERRYKKARVFLIGHGILILGFIFFTVGFGTDHWLSDEGDKVFGLWTRCLKGVCTTSYSVFTSWMIATRSMQTLALLCYTGGMLLALFFHCAAMTVPRCSSLAGKARVLELSVLIGSCFCLIGVIVYGVKGNRNGDLGYSYALTVTGLILNAIGLVMVAVTRNHISYNATASSTANGNIVAPQGPLPNATATMTSGQYPAYPYGHGAAEFGADGGGRLSRTGTRDNVYPYGTGGGGSESPPYSNPIPSSQQEILPYAVNPGRSASMPEEGRRRGRRGGNGPAPSGRLPPISSHATPSAPPPHIDDDHPPSYEDAVRGSSQP